MRIIKTSNYKKSQFSDPTYDPQNMDPDTNLPYDSPSLEDRYPSEEFTERKIDNSPLDGKSNEQSRKIVRNLIYSLPTKGFFSDESWEGIKQIWDAFDNAGINWAMTGSEYIKDERGIPTAKQWKFEINFTNNKQRPTTLYGTVIAHGAGTVEDPLSRYDITVTVN